MNSGDEVDKVDVPLTNGPSGEGVRKGSRPNSSDAAGGGESLADTRKTEATSQVPPKETPGETVGGRYEILELIGEGGMGILYRATDPKLRREVAVKRLRATEDSAKKGIARFLQEARAIAALNHRNIVTIHDLGEDDKGPFIVMEYLRGEDLRRRIEREGKIELEGALSIVRGVGQGLAYAHNRGIIHRDVKPANIILTKDGTPKLLDFGLALVPGESGLSRTGETSGTWAYMSPEQMRDAKHVDQRSDIYGLAKTLYYMVTGKTPDSIDLDIVPSEMRPALEKALKPAREDRPFSVKQFLNELGQPAAVVGTPLAPGTVLPGTCLNCGAANAQGMRFCHSCGAGLFEKCPRCNVEGPLGVKHCGSCGVHISGYKEAKRALSSAQKHLKKFEYDNAEKEARRGLRWGALRDELKGVLEEATTSKKRLGELRARVAELVEKERYEDAVALLRSALELDPSQEDLKALVKELPGRIREREVRRALVEAGKALEEKRFSVALERCEWVLGEQADNEEAPELKAQAERLQEDHRGRVAQARKSLKASRFNEALEQLRSLEEDYPWDDEIKKLLQEAATRKKKKLDELRTQAMELIEKEQYEDAEAPLRSALELDPSQEDLKALLEELPGRIREREVRRALAKAGRALAEKRFPVALERCEWVLEQEVDNEEAAKLRTQAESLQEDHHGRMGQARRSLEASRFNEALEQLRSLEEDYPWDDEINKLLQEAGTRKKKKLDDLRAQAMEFIEKERYEDAEAPLRSALELDPSQEDLKALLEELPARIRERGVRRALAEAGRALEEKRFPVALERCEWVLEQEVDNEEAGVLRLHAEKLRKDHQLRLARARKLLEASQLNNALEQLAELGNDYPWDDEIKKLHEAATPKKKKLDELRAQAVALIGKERYEEAEGPLRSALDVDRSQEDLKSLLKDLPNRIREREIRGALVEARKAIKEKRFPDALERCDWVLKQQADNKEAADLRGQAEKLQQDHQSRLARARESLDVLDASEFNKALEQLKDLEKDYPWDKDTKKLQGEATTRREKMLEALRDEAGQLIEEQRYEDAEEPLRGALTLDPSQKDLEALRKALPNRIQKREIRQAMDEARNALREKRFSVALEHCDWVLREQPGNKEAADLKAQAEKLQRAAKAVAIFGNYEAVAQHARTVGATVWSARPVGASSPPTFAVKSFDPSGSGWEEERVTMERESFLDGIRTQLKVAAGDGQHWAPILESGTEEDKPFFVTKYYRRSVQWLIDRPFKLSSRTLRAIVSSVVEGLRELKWICGRPHGNLKPSNVLIEGEGSIKQGKVVLTDPLPSSRLDAKARGASDLQAIGTLIYQLVLRRPFRLMGGWPVPPSEAWFRLGKSGETWRKLCDRLLDPDPARSRCSLETVAETLRVLDKPRRVRTYAVVGASAAAVVLALALLWLRILQLPKIELLGDNPMVVEAGTGFNDPGWTATDRQDGDLTEKVKVRGSVDIRKPRVYPLVYRVKDSSGHEAKVTRTVKVVDTTAPVISLKGDSVVILGVDNAYEEPGYGADDNYDGDLTGKVKVKGSVNETKPGEYKLAYSVTDSSGNEGKVTRTVRVVDITAPVITLSGADVMTVEVGSAFKDPGWTATDRQDGDLTRKVKVEGSVDHTKLGEYRLSYTVTDSSENEGKVTRTVKVVDTTAPVISLKGDSVVILGAGNAYEEPGYGADDNYDGDLTAKVAVEGSVDHIKLGEYPLVYKVTDSSGNEGKVTRTVRVVDITAPVITLSGADVMTVEVGSAFKDPGWTATDRQDGDLTRKVKVEGSVDHTKLGEYRLSYTVTDSSENEGKVTRTVKVVDTTAPVISLKGDSVVILGAGNAYEELGYGADDNYDGDLTAKVAVEGSVDHIKPGEYKLAYSVSDSSGNEGKVTRTVRVVDTTPPVMALRGDSLVRLEVGDAYEEPGYGADDNYDGDLTAKVVVEGSVDHTKLGEYPLVYKVTDSSGNEGKVSRTVKVVDTTAPVISLKGDSVVILGVGDAYEEPGYGADDNYDGDLRAKVAVEGSVDHTKLGEYPLVYKVTDSSENEGKVSRTVKVVDVDIIAPVITLSGADVMTVEVGSAFEDPGWTAADRQDGDLTRKVKVEGSVDHTKLGEYRLTYTVTDSSENEGKVTRTVKVVDTTAPVVTLRGRDVVTLEVDKRYEEPGYTADDNYDGDIRGKVVIEGSVHHTKLGEYRLTYTVTDSSENEGKVTRTVKVVDTTAPVVTLRGRDVVTLEVDKRYEEPGYTANDNYDGDITGKVVVEGSVDHTKLGEYTLVYKVTDSSGNRAGEKRRTVRVVEIIFEFKDFWKEYVEDFRDPDKFKKRYARPEDMKWYTSLNLKPVRIEWEERDLYTQLEDKGENLVFKVKFKAFFRTFAGLLTEKVDEIWVINPETRKIIEVRREISVEPESLRIVCPRDAVAEQRFELRYLGGGELKYLITGDGEWLDCDPAKGNLTDQPTTVNVTYNTSGLPLDIHTAEIEIVAEGAGNTRRKIPVELRVEGWFEHLKQRYSNTFGTSCSYHGCRAFSI